MKKTKKKLRVRRKKGFSLKELSFVTITIGVVILAVNFQFFYESTQIFAILNMFAVIIILGIPLATKYTGYRNIKTIENMFPKYLSDISSNLSTGMTLPQAMRAVRDNDYGVLNKHVRGLEAKINWGIPFEKALNDFAEKTGSDAMQRNIQTIIETHRAGGTMDTILDSVASSLQQLEKIKKERSSSIYAQMINGYLIYIVFLGVMIGLSTLLVPAFQTEETADLEIVFNEMFRALTIIQGLFAGLAIGKMAEGTLTAGIKHAMVLVIFGFSVFLFFG